MADEHVHDQPSTAVSQSDGVHIEGPSGVNVVMTPAAAIETAKRIDDAAIDALLGRTEDRGANPTPGTRSAGGA